MKLNDFHISSDFKFVDKEVCLQVIILCVSLYFSVSKKMSFSIKILSASIKIMYGVFTNLAPSFLPYETLPPFINLIFKFLKSFFALKTLLKVPSLELPSAIITFIFPSNC